MAETNQDSKRTITLTVDRLRKIVRDAYEEGWTDGHECAEEGWVCSWITPWNESSALDLLDDEALRLVCIDQEAEAGSPWIKTTDQRPEIAERVLGYWTQPPYVVRTTSMYESEEGRDVWIIHHPTAETVYGPDYWMAIPETPTR